MIIFSFPINLITEALPNVLLRLRKVSKGGAIFLYLVFDTAATALGLAVVDYFMESVSATEISILVVSFLLSLMDVKDIGGKGEKGEGEKR